MKCNAAKILGVAFILVSVALTAFFFYFFMRPPASKRPPHIVLMIVDDLGWGDVSFHGSRQIPTPNVDVLAKDGVALHNYYTQPICSPSRGSLMTGKYPIRIGFQHDLILTSAPWGLPLEEKILPQHLKSLGYATHAVGKWHLGFFKEEYTPLKRGFDSFFGYYSGMEDYFTHFATEGNMSGLDLRAGDRPAWEYNETYGTELFTLKAKEVIKKHDATKPLFLYFAQQAPHSGNFDNPVQVPDKYVEPLLGIENEKRRKFAGMVSAMDQSVGEVLEALEEAALLDDTLFVFTSDNGAAVEGADGTVGSNFPLRGSKYTLWEGGVRAVSLVWSPLLRQRPHLYTHLMHVSDWLPTLLSAAGGPDLPKTLKDVDGVDQWASLLDDAPAPREEVLLNVDRASTERGVRWRNYKYLEGSRTNGSLGGWYDSEGRLIRGGAAPRPSPAALHTYERTYSKFLNRSKAAQILWQKYGKSSQAAAAAACDSADCLLGRRCGDRRPSSTDKGWCDLTREACLFDIQEDPCELHNIASQYPQITQRLESAIRKYEALERQSGSQPSDPGANPALHGGVWGPWK